MELKQCNKAVYGPGDNPLSQERQRSRLGPKGVVSFYLKKIPLTNGFYLRTCIFIIWLVCGDTGKITSYEQTH